MVDGHIYFINPQRVMRFLSKIDRTKRTFWRGNVLSKVKILLIYLGITHIIRLINSERFPLVEYERDPSNISLLAVLESLAAMIATAVIAVFIWRCP